MTTPRVAVLKSKYQTQLNAHFPTTYANQWQRMVAASASTRHRYLDWLIRQVLNTQECELHLLQGLLERFEQVKLLLPQRDINQYTAATLTQALSAVTGFTSKRQQKRQFRQMLEQDGHIIRHLHNEKLTLWEVGSEQGAAFLGRGSRWCTTSAHYSAYAASPLYVLKVTDKGKFQLCFALGEYSDENDDVVDIAALLSSYPELLSILVAEPSNLAEPALLAQSPLPLTPTQAATLIAENTSLPDTRDTSQFSPAVFARAKSMNGNSGDNSSNITVLCTAQMTNEALLSAYSKLSYSDKEHFVLAHADAALRLLSLLSSAERLIMLKADESFTATVWHTLERQEQIALLHATPKLLMLVLDKVGRHERMVALQQDANLIRYFINTASEQERLTALRANGDLIQYMLHDATANERLAAVNSEPASIKYFYPTASNQEIIVALSRWPQLVDWLARTLTPAQLHSAGWQEKLSQFIEFEASATLAQQFKQHIIDGLAAPFSVDPMCHRIADTLGLAKHGTFDLPWKYPDEHDALGYISDNMACLVEPQWVEYIHQSYILNEAVATLITEHGKIALATWHDPEELANAFAWLLQSAAQRLPDWILSIITHKAS